MGTMVVNGASHRKTPKIWDVKLLDDRGLKFEPVKIADINVDMSYQRPLREAKIATMWHEFDPAEMTAIVVSRRKDGSMWVVDGQHRIELLSRLGKAVVLADVREGLTVEEEAHLFYRLNEGQTRVGAWDKFKARLRAKEPNAVKINEIVERHGFHLGRTKEDKGIQAVSALEWAYTIGRLDKTMSIIETVWPNDNSAREADIILGVATFLMNFDTSANYDDGRLLVALDKIPASGITRRAKEIALETGRSGQKGIMVAFALRDAYNGKMVRGTKPAKQLHSMPYTTTVKPRDHQRG